MEFAVDTKKLVKNLLRRWWILALAAVLGGAVALLGTAVLVSPTYEADILFRVSGTGELGEDRDLVDSCVVLLDSRACLEGVSDRDYAQLRKMITAEAVNGTEFLRVTVSTEDPREAAELAAAVGAALPALAAEVMPEVSLTVVDGPVVPDAPACPGWGNSLLIGGALGLLLGLGALMAADILKKN